MATVTKLENVTVMLQHHPSTRFVKKVNN